MNHVHFIGICGTAMAPVAKMFQDMGWRVTGSDKAIYPPVSEYLQENRIPVTLGWHPERMGNPDLVVMGNFHTSNNPEYVFAKEKGFRVVTYPEALGEFLIKENSMVVVGTAGKTTISGLLAWVFETAGLSPSFMSAGIQKNFPDGVRNTPSPWSIVEGDEPFASKEIQKSKFFFYKPTHVILTGAEWDHKDMFPSPESYIENFVQFLKLISPHGLIVANRDGENVKEVVSRYEHEQVKKRKTAARIVWYGEGKGSYEYSNIKILESGKVAFSVLKGETVIGEFTSNLIGKYNVENATAAIAMSIETGISVEDIQKGIATFEGIGRRMDVRYDDGKRKVIDDFAHNTMKFKNAIGALRMHYPKEKLVVVVEPNIGSRTKESLPLFRGVFREVDLLMLPEFSMTTLSDVISAEDVQRIIEDDTDVVVVSKDEELVSRAVEEIRDGGIICFMGSHGFRGMIEMTVKRLEKE